jgi:hypothetical protein
MMSPRRVAFAVACFSLLSFAACASPLSGYCNICPGATSTNPSACAEQLAANHCSDGGIVVMMDIGCGSPDGGYLACFFTDCDKSLDCSLIATY